VKNNLALDPSTNDLLESGNQIQQVTGLDAIAQGVASDLRTFLGEYWLDRSLGVPYFTVVFKKGTDLSLIKTLLRDEIQKRDDVIEVTSFTFDYIENIRSLVVVFSAKTTQGQIDNQEIVL
jgi:hypothetical protein